MRGTDSSNYPPPNSNPHSRCIMELTQDYLKSILHYNPDTGVFTYTSTSRNGWNGRTAGSIDYYGYRNLRILGTIYKAHRVAFLYMNGRWPTNDIDHINGTKDDNRWLNIRDVTKSGNLKNQKLNSRNTSRCTGVSWCAQTKKWVVRIKDGKQYRGLGRYGDFFEAVCARKRANIKFGYDSNHGRAD